MLIENKGRVVRRDAIYEKYGIFTVISLNITHLPLR